ncbi:ABC transporter ATP-binding protein [Conexibacter woesei]|uniref:ABC transporter related protein n=1 Tax=Conexibacter woesei (strain DSM 14684 / CCUG 47730 / CIP 108061 / JCM 11494 / NBRC 100937 / ID131577) TaxID=469383 RepID=D3F0U2_CONWI|nr:ABC transporter ATP-binding protein [Conexibacter woesei]ADB54026.1 ABC transporter related protein [Conexibacter woesei DSM 14684]
MLEVHNLVKHYASPGGESVQAVDGVSLTVRPGELVALYGPSGSGKTTLLKIVAAVLEPDRGEVLVNGRSVTGLSDREATAYRLADLGLVLQTSHMIAGLTAIENASLKLIASGVSRRDAERQLTPLLERLGLDGRAEHRANDLSMGERQRLALAKSLSNDPSLLLADEPTGNLDTARGRDVLAFLREYSREHRTAILIATHDPQAVSYADHAHTLRDGRLTEFCAEVDAQLGEVTVHQP